LNLLLEIGTEEIPDWMIPDALAQMRTLFGPAENVQVDATSRRLVLRAAGLAERQADREEYVAGPGLSAPAAAIEGFARKQGVARDALEQRDGKYGYTRKIPGRETRELLAHSLPELMGKIAWPKTMFWGAKGSARFIRPVRWTVALLDDKIIPFEFAGVKSSAESSGHRQLGKAKFPVTFASYEQALRDNGVILSADERRTKILRELPKDVRPDASLLETLVYLTEFPTVVTGEFEPAFLSLPAEVLSTVMRFHQKYFSIDDGKGGLAARFAAVMNTSGDPAGLVRHGNERVLRARFNDARFFWDTDQHRTLDARVEDLKHVTFQAKLGNYYEKTQRVEGLVAVLGGDAHALRAARLCKADLTTELVKEFTELQGVVGGLYAKSQGEPEEVSLAVYDHYKPVSMEDSIPRTEAGQFVAIADKLDTLIGCFQVGLIPSGSKDPFALRRAAQGIVKIIVEANLNLPLRSYVRKNPRLEEFVLDRVRNYFRDFAYDEINAVLASGWDSLPDVSARLIALKAVRPTADFEPLAASFKRIRNILKQASFTSAPPPSAALLEDGPERELFDAFERIQTEIATLPYQPALERIATLRPAVDRFFDKVMVNVPDVKIRANRLALLNALSTEFSKLADFSEIVIQTQETKV